MSSTSTPAVPAEAAQAEAPLAQHVRVRAKKALGVPVHTGVGDTEVSARLPDGATVEVLQRARDGAWLQVESKKRGVTGWISRRYVDDRPAPVPRAAAAPRIDAKSPWASEAACRERVRAKQLLARGSGKARLGTWNIEWFPDGGPRESESPTDLGWLACTIAWMNVDVLALQEIKSGERSEAALKRLTALLADLTGEPWRVETDRCKDEDRQRVALLINTGKVKHDHTANVASLNPAGGCKQRLRPGLVSYLQFPGGLDLHAISVHLKSGRKASDRKKRMASVAALGGVFKELQRAAPDSDVVVLGDFNSMGCADPDPVCSAASDWKTEGKALAKQLAELKPGFELVPTAPERACSHYYRGRGGLLDHHVVTAAATELEAGVLTQVQGYCAELGCGDAPEDQLPKAYHDLSDHCPLLLDFVDEDRD